MSSNTRSGERPDTSAQPAEEGEPFQWEFRVHVRDQNQRPIAGAEVNVRIVGRTTEYSFRSFTNDYGWVTCIENAYPSWQAVITVSKPGYISLTETVQAGRASIYFYLPYRSPVYND